MLEDKRYKIGVDFGGSHCGVGITDNEGEVLNIKHINIDVTKMSNQEEKKQVIVDTIIQIIGEAIKDSDVKVDNIDFIGVGVPGSYKGTKILNLPNVGLKDFDIGDALRNSLNQLGLNKDIKIVIENDANCAAVGELSIRSIKRYIKWD